jgi:hypothetical protein
VHPEQVLEEEWDQQAEHLQVEIMVVVQIDRIEIQEIEMLELV